MSLANWWVLRARSEVRSRGGLSLTTVMQLTRLGLDPDAIEKEHKK